MHAECFIYMFEHIISLVKSGYGQLNTGKLASNYIYLDVQQFNWALQLYRRMIMVNY